MKLVHCRHSWRPLRNIEASSASCWAGIQKLPLFSGDLDIAFECAAPWLNAYRHVKV